MGKSKLSYASKRTSSVTFITTPKTRIAQQAKKVAVPERMTYKILLDGVDVTPKNLTPPAMYSEETQMAVHDISKDSEFTLQDGKAFSVQQSEFQTQLHYQTVKAEHTFLSHYGTVGTFPGAGSQIDLQEAPFHRYESEEDIVNQYSKTSLKLSPLIIDETLPKKVNLTLTETPVIFLFELTSIIEQVGTGEGDAVIKDNEHYEYITKGKGRNRKVLNAETQTNAIIVKTRSTNIKRINKMHNDAFASGWDMLDSRAVIEEEEITDSVELDPIKEETKLKVTLCEIPVNDNDNESQMRKLNELISFQNATMIMERILDGNIFNIEQTRIRGLHPPDPFAKDVEFRYSLDLLWVFFNQNLYDRPISMISFNSQNEDIIAVGYGKFYFNETKRGVVCVWNIKNPSQPERYYEFPVAVTGVAFGKNNPNQLAVGFYDGTCCVIDIIHINTKIIGRTTKYTTLSFFPILDIAWVQIGDKNDERIIVVGGGGRVSVYRHSQTKNLLGICIMHVHRLEGKVKGIPRFRPCIKASIPISVFSTIECFTDVPYDKTLYMIGTNSGTVHKCSKYYLNQHIDVFLAHNGPVYKIQYSPFCERIFLTCGADWAIRIWSENIYEPLVTLKVPLEPVQMACWNPYNSTIIAGVSGFSIYIWDIRKKTYLPSSVTPSPTKVRITTIAFTSTGRNIIIGDLDGKLHLFSLENVPFPPFYQTDVLIHCIHKALVTRPDIIRQLKKTSKEFEKMLTLLEGAKEVVFD